MDHWVLSVFDAGSSVNYSGYALNRDVSLSRQGPGLVTVEITRYMGMQLWVGAFYRF